MGGEKPWGEKVTQGGSLGPKEKGRKEEGDKLFLLLLSSPCWPDDEEASKVSLYPDTRTHTRTNDPPCDPQRQKFSPNKEEIGFCCAVSLRILANRTLGLPVAHT